MTLLAYRPLRRQRATLRPHSARQTARSGAAWRQTILSTTFRAACTIALPRRRFSAPCQQAATHRTAAARRRRFRRFGALPRAFQDAWRRLALKTRGPVPDPPRRGVSRSPLRDPRQTGRKWRPRGCIPLTRVSYRLMGLLVRGAARGAGCIAEHAENGARTPPPRCHAPLPWRRADKPRRAAPRRSRWPPAVVRREAAAAWRLSPPGRRPRGVPRARGRHCALRSLVSSETRTSREPALPTRRPTPSSAGAGRLRAPRRVSHRVARAALARGSRAWRHSRGMDVALGYRAATVVETS